MIKSLLHNISIAQEAMLQNKLRSMLTSLGIICGVASVIAMLAIGKGAEQEILEKMKLLGTNNIIIKPLDKKAQDEKMREEDDENGENGTEDITKKKKRFSPGLNLKDARGIMDVVPHVQYVSPEVVVETMALRSGFKRNVNLVGVTPVHFSANMFEITEGSFFNENQIKYSMPVCVIGQGVKARVFATENPIGKNIKCGNKWLKVVGVLKGKNVSKENIKNLGLRDFNDDVYIPLSTMLIRYKNRSLVTKKDLQRGYGGGGSDEEENINQLDKIIVGITDTKYIRTSAEVISRMLKRRHNNEMDYEVIVPELLLEQEQRTKSIFNIVLGAIASISLIVGGIGIMNIMLASVLERTKEIGIRRALGAKYRDILTQFLSEAVAISLTGGFIGIISGIILSLVIEKSTGIETIVSGVSVALSFLVSISVGLIFGIMPARKAARQDPIVSLRYE